MKDALFGALAVRAHFVLEHQVQEALNYQRQMSDAGQPVPRLGEILAHHGYMTPEQVQAILKGQYDQGSQRFGDLAVSLRFCAQDAIEAAVQVQQQIRACGSNQRLGEILVARGALRPHQVHSVLSAQGKSVVQCPNCKASMNVRGLAAGVSVNCPKCRSIFQPVALQTDPSLPQQPPVDVSSEKYVGAEVSVVMNAVSMPQPSSQAAMSSASAIGPYQLSGKLGSDSSGVLYKATEPRTGRALVIRLLSPSIAGNKEAIERWTASGQAASELSHPNLQRILSIEGEGGRAYIVMEYVEGESLRKLLSKGGRYSPVETVDVMIQAAEALNYGHANGFLHGDLRPNHILMGTDGIVRVAGLGTPKSVAQNLRQVAAQLGDEALPLYTPPELILDEEKADERSDVFSLGAIGYHMLTGRPPHEGNNVLQVGLKIAAEELISPTRLNVAVPAFLNRLVCKCLEAEPDDRYDTIAELLEDLRKSRHALSAGLADVQEIAPVPTHTQRFRAVTSRRSTPRRRVRTSVQRRPGSTGKFNAVSRVKSAVQPGVGAKTAKFGAVGQPRQSGVGPAVQQYVPGAEETKHMAAAAILANTPPPEDHPELAEAELEAELEQLQKKKQRKTGEKLSTGVNTTYVLVGVGAIILAVGGIIFYSMNQEPKRNTVSIDPVPTTAPKTDEPTKVVIAGDPAASREWRLTQEYIAENGSDTAGIVKRLDTFRIKFVDAAEPAPQAAEAKEQLKTYSTRGADATIAALKADVTRKADTDQFGESVKTIDRWEEQWHAGADTAAKAKALREEIAAKQKQLFDKLMADALSLRKQRKFADANLIYKRISGAFDTNYASEARKAVLESGADAETAKTEIEKQQAAEREMKEKFDRENAAPARLKGLENEIDQALRIFDIERAKKSLDAAGPLLLPTQLAPDYTALKTDLGRLEALRGRMAAGIKGGKFADPKVAVKGAQYTAVDATDQALVLETNGAKMNLPWTDVSADDLGDIAKKATNEKSGAEVLDYAMLRYHLGSYREARNALEDAQKLGAVVSRYAPRIEAKIKDIASKPVEVPKTPVVAPVEPTVVKLPAGMDKEAYDALKAKGLDHQRGVWQIAGDGSFRCFNDPDPTNKSPTLMSLKRAIAKNFKKISIEVRGSGDETGFSFGTGRRFVVKPSTSWQTISVERSDKEITMKVDGKAAKSLDEIGADVKPDNLAADGLVYIRFVGSQGDLRNLIVEE